MGAGTSVPPSIVDDLARDGLIEPPLPELPLFGKPSRDGTITQAGRAALLGARGS